MQTARHTGAHNDYINNIHSHCNLILILVAAFRLVESARVASRESQESLGDSLSSRLAIHVRDRPVVSLADRTCLRRRRRQLAAVTLGTLV